MPKKPVNERNRIELGRGIYLVRTQAGFRKALRDLFIQAGWPWQDRHGRWFDYPRDYPQVVLLEWDDEQAKPRVRLLRKEFMACVPFLEELRKAEENTPPLPPECAPWKPMPEL